MYSCANRQPPIRKMNFLASTILVLWTVGCVGALPEISFSCTNKSIPWPECYHVLNIKPTVEVTPKVSVTISSISAGNSSVKSKDRNWVGPAWDHFSLVNEAKGTIAICNHCNARMAASNSVGTSSLLRHMQSDPKEVRRNGDPA
ncbi:hypothetical protein KEM48_002871 [Puccinia striiformis f. sp. tritici PST-130]|nr:hypothetical protein KEM48_002871 [Puccinia striiformis f. sp. tritici PST-130]